MKRSFKKKVLAVGLIGGVAAAGTGAYALWTAGGTGTGTAKALTAQAITVTASTGAADLYPGFTGGDLSFTLSNPNPYPVTLNAMSLGSVTSSNSGACAASNVSVAVQPVSIVLAAGAVNSPQVISDVVTMSSSALDGCQGVSFNVGLTLTGSQS
jgi:hypothetical protein